MVCVASGLCMLLYVCAALLFTPFTIFSLPPSHPQTGDCCGFALQWRLIFKAPPEASLKSPLSEHTSFQHDLWVASNDTRVGLRWPLPPPLPVTCTHGFTEWGELDFLTSGN